MKSRDARSLVYDWSTDAIPTWPYEQFCWSESPKLVNLDLKSHKLIITWWTSILHNFLFKYLSFLAVKRLTIPVNISFEYFFVWMFFFSRKTYNTSENYCFICLIWIYWLWEFYSVLYDDSVDACMCFFFLFFFSTRVCTLCSFSCLYVVCLLFTQLSRDYSHDN